MTNRFAQANLAQMVEQLIRNQQAASSILAVGSRKFKGLYGYSLYNPSSFAFFQGSKMIMVTENPCGLDPRNPYLSSVKPIQKAKGSLPPILSLAAERVKA